MRHITFALLLTGCAAAPAPEPAPDRYLAPGGIRVALLAMPFHGERNAAERSGGPASLVEGGVQARLTAAGALAGPVRTVELTAEERALYGERRRMALANAHLADLVATSEREGALTVGLLANCTSLLGVLAGLQHVASDGKPLRVGLVFIDAHGDFNTPETSLSGMLGGMPVAVAAGLGLHNLRRGSGLDPALPSRHIVLAAARDLDPLEAQLVEDQRLERLSVADLRAADDSPAVHRAMGQLSRETDLIYVHIDMDVLDPAEVPGHPLTVPDGPTSAELAAALRVMFRYPRTAALGIASTPYGERDPDSVSREAAYRLIEGALAGVRDRTTNPAGTP